MKTSSRKSALRDVWEIVFCVPRAGPRPRKHDTLLVRRLLHVSTDKPTAATRMCSWFVLYCVTQRETEPRARSGSPQPCTKKLPSRVHQTYRQIRNCYKTCPRSSHTHAALRKCGFRKRFHPRASPLVRSCVFGSLLL